MPLKTSKGYAAARLLEGLRQARLAKGWSQRELSARAEMPQAQISRIETGDVDPQLSTLLELARTLGLDIRLAPRSALPAVDAAIRSAEWGASRRAAQEVVARLVTAAKRAREAFPERDDIAMINTAALDLQAVATAPISSPELDAIRRTAELLEQVSAHPPSRRSAHGSWILDAAARLRSLRNKLVHMQAAERPAYTLDDEDER